ncbi:hypothetical protein [Winogradskyella flava]|uniref:Type IV leader peptidase family protein n=1 Tax=Winogradskyella flava TaxID=1884876 RepID=A0A842IPB4_9FLAO|nr:hypothetical protein [Winogradskyella flava]MBC2844621.1 hypothetical protein [Winogradskyella flava]
MPILKIILICTLALIFYQDLKERQVYWFLFPLFAACSAVLFYTSTIPELFYVSVGMNIICISILLLIVFLYSRLKLKTTFYKTIGLGDVLLFVGLVFSFSTISFLVIFVFSLLFALVSHLLVKQYSKFHTVPLAGYISLFYGIAYISYWTGLTPSLYAF